MDPRRAFVAARRYVAATFRLLRTAATRAWAARRAWRCKAALAAVGAAGGWAGAAIGLLLGALLDEAFSQAAEDGAVEDYLAAPGPSAFPEPCPGAAAFCALLVLSRSERADDGFGPRALRPDAAVLADAAARAALAALRCQPSALPRLEAFCRAALRRRDCLNVDLLSESLSARRAGIGDAAALGAALLEFASGPAGAALARRAADVLGTPAGPTGPRPADAAASAAAPDPWRVLGLEPGADPDEIKAVYRRLASQFHPDALAGLDADRARSAADAFILIESAYRELLARSRP